MAVPTERRDPFVFIIPSPRARRVIALVMVAFYLLIGGFLILKIGAGRMLDLFLNDLAGVFLFVVLVAAIAFFWWLAFPPQGLLDKLEFRPDSVSFVPNRMTRRLFAEKVTTAAITQQSKEILLCLAENIRVPAIRRSIRTPGCICDAW